jgi:hypothetical protein
VAVLIMCLAGLTVAAMLHDAVPGLLSLLYAKARRLLRPGATIKSQVAPVEPKRATQGAGQSAGNRRRSAR